MAGLWLTPEKTAFPPQGDVHPMQGMTTRPQVEDSKAGRLHHLPGGYFNS